MRLVDKFSIAPLSTPLFTSRLKGKTFSQPFSPPAHDAHSIHQISSCYVIHLRHQQWWCNDAHMHPFRLKCDLTNPINIIRLLFAFLSLHFHYKPPSNSFISCQHPCFSPDLIENQVCDNQSRFDDKQDTKRNRRRLIFDEPWCRVIFAWGLVTQQGTKIENSSALFHHFLLPRRVGASFKTKAMKIRGTKHWEK